MSVAMCKVMSDAMSDTLSKYMSIPMEREVSLHRRTSDHWR